MSARHIIAGVLALGLLAFAGELAFASAAGKAPHLRKGHAGWRKTDCASCHDAVSLAKKHAAAATLAAPDCGACHGYNGAPHEAHAVAINPCANCHSTVVHLKAFQVPGDCIKCHVHPQSPQGR
jgi:hypothetical protein